MFPNSSNLGRPPFPPKHQQQSNFFTKLPLNTPPALVSHQQSTDAQFNFQNAALSRALLSGNLVTVPAVTLQPMTYGNGGPVHVSDVPTSFRGRKRRSEQSLPHDTKRRRFQSHHSETPVVNQAVPLPEERRYSFPGSIQSPLFHARFVPNVTGCVPPLRDTLFPDPIETALPVAKDKLSQQVLELFQACQQQTCDLNRKELCRTELQREIQLIFPQSRLFLVGSSLNGFGTRTSDGDLCLVVKEEPVNQKTEARHILSLVQKLFSTKLSSYIERPQLIRAKVPIVKFRDKVSCVEFDLNVNNVVGIRNTFLLRTYAYIENRVRPLVLVVKKWASFHDINDASRGTLSSYSLVLMVLHYLQTLPEPILPSLQKNYPESFDPTMQLHFVHQAPCTVPPYLSKNASSLGDLLIGFFKYYATEFDWSRQMISVREAKAIPRPDGIEWRNKYICVEEPFDRTNTARAVHEKQKFDIIKGEFVKSWQVLRDKKDLSCILPLRRTILKR
ncbi:poly(A) RNA polymerase GLD2 isoform X1 [Egretta garzetta]|uniref:poly(A) RNA polymerase GLD2 isoform X1 n=1 Tax=Egretta garzetta TaxID=188379 RepID=UPI00051EFF65|nr:poly(A) RNA polymerase GLD2 isoform X1 [Egretta garzetta]XP_035748731.1 poly(A) RNA polymerase GLD2 isoform X1 [Egretta garzetta]XP_035748732.1 poly(A) RNA polymerase GLD2 isoform X1 [Egretta garzetta]XP_035748733.1 poly(A) RNA polymerase GLD2 isoform X1 [Egretta garzetta]XP_035748734.1 poly(A) RNA polymerase GLD2 isoform X1 [Egretta garzetta]XP_035748735.1 poly(A) RNA polymerase GLD2 isoform X1 [Egretta garzetta]XP_035748736.1 poly(A) RNA polymerase GLD2 isoform X1 [Egretta garzetta]XP_0